MAVYPGLGASLSTLNILTIHGNDVVTCSVRKYIQDFDEEHPHWKFWWFGKKEKVDGHYYVALMHGPEKHYRFIVTGNDGFATADSAEKAAELLLKYARELEPMPEGYYPHEEQLMLFAGEELPEMQAA